MVIKYLKAASIAAALALMIPLSAYAAEAEQVNSSSAAAPEASDSGTDLPVQTQTDAGGGPFWTPWTWGDGRFNRAGSADFIEAGSRCSSAKA